MAKIKYIEHGGKEHEIDVPNGLTVMEGAIKNNIPGIDADCGGACACATCHVWVDEQWVDKVGKPDETSAEQELLDYDPLAKPNSRLSCQITLEEKLDGLIVHIPKQT